MSVETNANTKGEAKNGAEVRITALSGMLRLRSFMNYRQICDPTLSLDENLVLLLENEHMKRSQARIEKEIRKSGIPVIKRFADFEMDAKYLPRVDADKLKATASCDFIGGRQNVIFVGPSGRGKTHMAIAIGIEAIGRRHKVIFRTADQIVTEMTEAKTSQKLGVYLKDLMKADLLILDELGYCSYSLEESSMLFRVISERNEKLSTIITTNHKFSKWGDFICGEELTAAMVERVCAGAIIFNMGGPKGYRVRKFVLDVDTGCD
jgi:DNA replication protein DnaC